MENTFTIKQVCNIINKSNTTVYRLIKGGKLPAHTIVEGGQQVWKVKKEDLETYLGRKLDQPVQQGFTLTEDTLTAVIQKAIQEQSTQLMKPMEESALFMVGKLSTENQFLREKIEALTQEIQELQGALTIWKTQERERQNKWWHFW